MNKTINIYKGNGKVPAKHFLGVLRKNPQRIWKIRFDEDTYTVFKLNKTGLKLLAITTSSWGQYDSGYINNGTDARR